MDSALMSSGGVEASLTLLKRISTFSLSFNKRGFGKVKQSKGGGGCGANCVFISE